MTKGWKFIRINGTITKDGEVTSNLKHTKPEGYASQVRTGRLEPDGTTIHLHAKWDGGEQDLTWTLKESSRCRSWRRSRRSSIRSSIPTTRRSHPTTSHAPQPEEPSADQPKTTIVEAKGSGKDRDEALKDAFREAVRKVVGAYVEEDTVVKNDQVIKDQVLTYSGGCVKTHGILSEDSKDGAVHVTIWALVEQDKVVKRLRAASVSVKEFAGGKMWDEIQSKRWKDKEAEAMLRSVLKGFPGNCMKAEVVGIKPEDDTQRHSPDCDCADQRRCTSVWSIPREVEERP